MKSLKKELGNEVKEKIRLEKELEEILIANENKVNKRSKKKKKKSFEEPVETELALTNSEIFCSICAQPIPNFQPE